MLEVKIMNGKIAQVVVSGEFEEYGFDFNKLQGLPAQSHNDVALHIAKLKAEYVPVVKTIVEFTKEDLDNIKKEVVTE